MDYKFDRPRLNQISQEKILQKLEIAAKALNYVEFSRNEFRKVAGISHHPVVKLYGSWKNAQAQLKLHLSKKGITLHSRETPFNNRKYSNQQLFDEMERVWSRLNHRPSRTEWELSNPKISYQTYKQRFQGWTNACQKFIEYKMGKFVPVAKNEIKSISNTQSLLIKLDKRDIPLGIRFNVLKRDSFKCVICGKSPAMISGLVLHIDHVIPFSKGGKSTLDNLQTLCSECNLGKSDR